MLFEMLTGRSPFAGQTASDTIAATLEREPPWASLPPAVSPRIRELLQRCLEKDPRQRLRDIGDAAGQLGDRQGVESSASHRRGFISAAIAAAVASAAAAFWLLPLQSMLPATAPESRLVIDNLALDSPHVAFSPDGASLVIQPRFDRPERLIVRKVSSTEERALPGTEGAILPFWSPDGRSIAFLPTAS